VLGHEPFTKAEARHPRNRAERKLSLKMSASADSITNRAAFLDLWTETLRALEHTQYLGIFYIFRDAG
jgi:hypothetical protein